MGVVAFKAHKKADEGRAWDGSGARKRLLEWAGGPDKENVDWGKFAQGFAWFDSEKKDTTGAYKLPHSDVIDGEICDVWRGVSAAMGALLGGRGGVDIPEGDKKGVHSHLSQHYKQFEKEPPELREYSEGELTALFPELDPVAGEGEGRLSMVRASLVSEPVEMQGALDLINAKFAKTALRPEDVYLLPPAELSNKNLDSYFTRMAESSLRNYLRDALAGVPLMNSHRRHPLNAELPLGQSYNAMLEEGADNLRLVAYFYMLRHLEINDVKTDHLIRAVEGGIVKDTSIGWDGGRYVCGLCSKPFPTWEYMFGLAGDEDEEKYCLEHIPGVTYDGRVAWAWVEDASLVEGSLVYAGATPEAVLRKARWAAAHGRLARGQASVLEDRWGVRIWQPSKALVAGLGARVKEGDSGEGVSGEVTNEEVLALVRERAPELVDRIAETENAVAAILDAWTEAREIRAEDSERIKAEMAGLQALAADGQAYRDELVAQAVAARVRAQGEAFDAEAYKATLLAQPLAYVRSEIAAWEKTAAQVFEPGAPVGKVLSRGGEQPTQKQQPARLAQAYKA